MKVKLICCNDANKLEGEINTFIEDKKVIDVKYQSVCLMTSFNTRGTPVGWAVNDRALIMYEEKGKDD